MSQAIGILELTSIAKGMELGDAMLKAPTSIYWSARPSVRGSFY